MCWLTPVPSTSTRRRPTWCDGSTWQTRSRWGTRPSPATRPPRPGAASTPLLPLCRSCDRCAIGGVAFDPNPGTGRLTVFVYDGHHGGAGFAERGYHAAREWLRATALAIESCGCEAGCPACIQ